MSGVGTATLPRLAHVGPKKALSSVMDLIVGGILKRDLKSGVDNLLWLIIIKFCGTFSAAVSHFLGVSASNSI